MVHRTFATSYELRSTFIEAMSRLAATVNIVTTDGPAGRAGVTVSAMSTVSADSAKPTLLVCIHQRSPVSQAILSNGAFCVNALGADQSRVSDTFSGRLTDGVEDKFFAAAFSPGWHQQPRMTDALVSFDCSLLQNKLVGTHQVMLGEVQQIMMGQHQLPLIYANREYVKPTPIEATYQRSAA